FEDGESDVVSDERVLVFLLRPAVVVLPLAFHELVAMEGFVNEKEEELVARGHGRVAILRTLSRTVGEDECGLACDRLREAEVLMSEYGHLRVVAKHRAELGQRRIVHARPSRRGMLGEIRSSVRTALTPTHEVHGNVVQAVLASVRGLLPDVTALPTSGD